MRNTFLLTVLIALLMPHTANALNLEDYNKVKDKHRKALTAHLESVGLGFLWANATLNGDGKAQLYCGPPRLTLNGDNFLQILDDYIKLEVDLNTPDTPIEMLLLNALRREFPCDSPPGS